MAAAIPACEEKAALCRHTYDQELCAFANKICDEIIGNWVMSEVRPGGWNPYDTRLKCERPPLCSDYNKDETLEFLNQAWVQESLGFSHFQFELIDFEVNKRWEKGNTVWVPVTQELTRLLDNTDIRFLFINGNNDLLVNTPGQMRLLDQMAWNGQAQFRTLEYRDWFYKNGELSDGGDGGSHKGGIWKGHGPLNIFAVDEAGHFAPMNQPEAIGAVMRAWLRL
ncbi:hypothetical protein NM208_g15258 [Fusarium decemcellulare]|uniref:Uncharacterized protein n=1 Tax=Fusarium decemcellulare TaxID=57161 RepID=A0ACC1RDI5_9HYPO|nr:hypothetical protein NM208_g15258 [Fusarium decemcellulare]